MDMKYTNPNVHKDGKNPPQYINLYEPCKYSICPSGKFSYRFVCVNCQNNAAIPPVVSAASPKNDMQAAAKNSSATISDLSVGGKDGRLTHEEGLHGRGLLHFEQWWKLRDIDVSVGGALLSGVTAFIEKNTLRIINNEHSYFIPLEKVDYIRTNDGLESSFRRKPFFNHLDT